MTRISTSARNGAADWFAGSVSRGPQITPEELWCKLLVALDWPAAASSLDYRRQNITIRQPNGRRVVVSRPCHDLPPQAPTMQKAMAGNLSVAEAVRDAADTKEETCLLVPLAQSNPYMLGNQRGHFALLSATLRDGVVQEATLYDPKAITSGLYPGARYVEEQLQEEGVPCATHVVSKPLAHQGLFNNTDCGRYVGAYVMNLAEGVSPEDLGPDASEMFE